MKTKSIDLTEHNVNIDALLDVFVETQKANGIDTGMEECDIDENGHRIMTKEKKESGCSGECGGKCKGCHPTKNDEKKEKRSDFWYMENRLGLFGQDMSSELEDDDEDNDGLYICEYCSDIGYRKEYKSYICDTCNTCETCPEFENEECSGCSYSTYRTGKPYSAELLSKGDDSYLDEKEKMIVKDIGDGVYLDNEVKCPDLSFTILDYDHNYS